MLHQACDRTSALISMPADPCSDIADRIGHVRIELDAIHQELRNPQPGCANLRQVRAYLSARAKAREAFGEHMFSDPAWDILVHLYAHHLAQRRSTISGLCGMAGVPLATGLRWIKQLEQAGHVERAADPLDARKQRIDLTSSGRDTLQAYFDALG